MRICNLLVVLPLIVVLAVVIPLTGCGDDGGTQPEEITVADFEGSWTGLSFTVTAKENPLLTADLVALGGSVEMTADDAGKFTGEMVIPEALGGPTTLPFTGTVSLPNQEMMTVTFDQEFPPLLTSFTGPFSYDGNTLGATDENTSFDFGEGEVPATATAVFERN